MKDFSWSWSRYSSFDTCPKRYYEVSVTKKYTDTSEHLDFGNHVHTSIAAALQDHGQLPDDLKQWQRWVDLYGDPSLPGEVYIEKQYALTKDFQKTSWRADDAWLRVIIDLLRVNGDVARMTDWKTGKKPTKDKPKSRQLMLCAQAVFTTFPEVKRILTEFVWLKDNSTTEETFDRDTIADHWPSMLKEVKKMEEAARTLTYPPKPNFLCARHCPVSSCPFFQKEID